MRKLLIFLFILFLLSSAIYSQDRKLIYSGGMLLFQPGYTITKNIESFGFGVGGILRFYHGEHFTLGLAGGNQKSNYNTLGSENSYFTLGYGGPLFGYSFVNNNFRFCASIGIARGRIKNLHISKQTGVVINNAEYYSYGVWIAYPLISLDYMLTKKISFTSQLINLTAVYNKNDLYFCPVFQLGILFNR